MSSNTSKPSKAVTLARVQALISGLEKHLPNGSISVGNAPFTTTSLVQLLQSQADAIAAVNAAHTSLKDALAALSATNAKVGPVTRSLRRIVQGMFAGSTQALADFGLEPPKARKPRTIEQNAAAAAKAKATRAKRGTTSKKQKLAIHGDVTGVTITPVIEPKADASPPEQQAPIAPGAPTPGATK
jgi:ABC-type transporter Mla subunit MlaD